MFDEQFVRQANDGLIKDLMRALVSLDEQEPVDYEMRNKAIIQLMALCDSQGYKVGIRIDPKEPEWPVVFIELPQVGQISYHLPQHSKPWDGHTTEEKLNRIRRFIAGV